MRVRARKALFGISWSYEDLAVEFAQNIGGERDLDITAAPLASILKADSGDTGPHK
jgi:hypothetical protein